MSYLIFFSVIYSQECRSGVCILLLEGQAVDIPDAFFGTPVCMLMTLILTCSTRARCPHVENIQPDEKQMSTSCLIFMLWKQRLEI